MDIEQLHKPDNKVTTSNANNSSTIISMPNIPRFTIGFHSVRACQDQPFKVTETNRIYNRRTIKTTEWRENILKIYLSIKYNICKDFVEANLIVLMVK